MKKLVKTMLIVLMVMINIRQINGQNDDVKYSTKEIETLTEELSWDSVGFTGCFTGLDIKLTGYAAERLVEIGKPASSKLLEVFVDEKKCVAAHLILTKIYSIHCSSSSTHITQKANSMPIVQKDNQKKKIGLAGILGIEYEYVGTIYRFNELEWISFSSGVQVVNKNDLLKNYEKWKQIVFKQQDFSE